MIAAPLRSSVSGSVRFVARHVRPDARRVVFWVDGRRLWAAAKWPYRFRGTGWLDTRRLSNGRHTLRVVVVFSHHRHARAAKVILVSNLSRIARVAGAHRTRPGRVPVPTTVRHPTTPVRIPTAPVSRPKAPVRSGTGGSTSTTGTTGTTGTTTTRTGSTGSGAGTPPTVGAQPTAGVVSFNRETYLYSTKLTPAQEAGRYQFLVLAGNQHSLIPQLKAFNPNLKILLYQSIMHTNLDDYADMQTVTGCTAAADDIANHPSWILHNAAGNLVPSKGHTSGLYLTDVGNPGYQQKCAQNAIALAKQYGFDGVFWDEVTGHLEWVAGDGVSVPEYPNNTAWSSAMLSAIDYLGPALHAQGLMSIGNMSGTPSFDAFTQWVAPLDGIEQESWTDANMGPAQQIPFFPGTLKELAWTQAHGKYELVHSYNGTEAGNTYGLAAMLLAADGTASYSTSNTDYTSNENWFPEYTTAEQLGAPTSAYTTLPNGVMKRTFAHGIVLVNDTGSSIPAFSLAGTYSGSNLTNVSAVSMAPTSGLILLKAS